MRETMGGTHSSDWNHGHPPTPLDDEAPSRSICHGPTTECAKATYFV